MRTGLVIDSTCDLPRAYIDAHAIELLPIGIRFGDKRFTDTRDPDETEVLLTQGLAGKEINAATEAPSVDEIKQFFLERIAPHYDKVLVVCMSRTRGRVFEHATKASFAILQEYRQVRAHAGLAGAFIVRVLDSKSLFSGEAVLAHEAARLLEEEQTAFEKVRQKLEALSEEVTTFLVPEDLYYVRERARQKGDRSLDLLTYQLGKAANIKPVVQMRRGETKVVAKPIGFDKAVEEVFGYAKEAIQRGLWKRLVAMSYAGNPRVIRETPAFQQFLTFAREHEIDILLSMMSATGGINVGPGAFSLAFV